MNKNIEIIALIYRSVDYLEFIEKQLLSEYCRVPGWKVGLKIVANDATEEILSHPKQEGIEYLQYNEPEPEDFYLNRVYRCWNFAGKTSEYSNICFVNSDMAFSDKWLENLLKNHDGINIPCSRLVESNKMPSGRYGVSYNLGRTPNDFNEKEWNNYSNDIKEDKVMSGGLYMPCVFETAKFKESGMYPGGNIFKTDRGLVAGYPNDRPVYKSGDDYFFTDVLEKKYNMKHVTVFDSLVYHIQEGEKDS